MSAPSESGLRPLKMDNAYRRKTRDRLVDALRAQLIGPSVGPNEELLERPDKRYLMGILFPRNSMAGQVVADEVTSVADEEESAQDPEEEGVDSPTDLMFQRLPASIGISFAIAAGSKVDLRGTVSCGIYEGVTEAPEPKKQRRKRWRRKPVPSAGAETVVLPITGVGAQRQTVLGGLARLHVAVREGPQSSWIVTASLINEAEVEPGKKFEPHQCLFQVGLEIASATPLRAWPTPERMFNDPEDDELALQYRSRPAMAVGHGCAVDWRANDDGGTTVKVEFMPTVEVPPITANIAGLNPASKRCLSLQYVQSDVTNPSELIGSLEEFVAQYACWRAGLENIRTPPDYDRSRQRILDRIDAALSRMRRGVDLVGNDPDALKCFRLAHRAMLLQMVFAGRVHAAEKGGQADSSRVDLDDSKYSGFAWRPFQMAFLLLSLVGLWEPESDDHDIVDLIWFPTGGGKTEAYLAVAAFEMLRRRLKDGIVGAGTAVLMRYTLRLLTQQQFQRAGHLICALEALRRGDPANLGSEPFSLGLWVGNKVTPGSPADAEASFDQKLRQQTGPVSNPFTLLRCPCCGTGIVPKSFPTQGAPGVGIRSSTNVFEFFCPDRHCQFSDRIPVQIVDDLLYREPPSMLLATLDKFAMMAWKVEASRLLGSRKQSEPQVKPPSLIIQDELHLISGPLGTIAGAYEAALDTAIQKRGGKPKIVASTATTRRVAEQGLALYGRSVEVFPPPGIDAGESFFSTTSSGDAPGRLYVGAMAQGHTPTFSNVLASAALLSAVPGLKLEPRVEDGWWTLVAYHNSRRELGRSLTLARDDIPSRILALNGKDGPGARAMPRVEELSANIKGDEIPLVLEALNQPRTSRAAVDYLGCTNMLSVGVDVDRLGLMLVIGQPKTASEYIQATSRVGRSSKYLPGLVLALYMPTKPRDRSHYEMFRPFHEALYRFVEPSSVTPYALPARERAFHAAVISAIRMVTTLGANEKAANFDPGDPEVRELLDTLYERMRLADTSEGLGIQQTAAGIESWWEGLATPGLRYATAKNANNYRPLIKRFGEEGHADAKETLQSMRHVDSSVRIKIHGQEQRA